MRRRNVFFLSILLASIGTVLILPATGWLARLELKGTIAISNPAMMGSDDLSKRSQTIAAANPGDFDLAYAATLRQAGPLVNTVGVTEGTSTRIPERLEALKAQFPNQPELYAHQLRYWTLGPLLLRHRDPEKPSPLDPKRTHTDIWVRAEQAAEQGSKLAPDNAYFPLMQAMALFAQGKDTPAYAALHTAANCPRYDDYIWQESTALWKVTDALNGQTGSVPKMAQMATILFPHYAQMRTLARLAAEEATRLEKAGDIHGALRLRHDTAQIGDQIRGQGDAIITNLIGIAMFHIACKGSPGWAEIETRNLSEEARSAKVQARAERYIAYLNSVGAKEEARFYTIGLWTATRTKQVARQISSNQLSGWDKLLGNIMKAGVAQAAGVLLLANMGWLLLLGAGAVLLCYSRGIRTGEGLPLLFHLGLWGAGLGIAIATAYLQARSLSPVQNLLNLSASTGGGDGGVVWPFLLMIALSFPAPLLTLLVLAIRGKIKRERVSVAVARGMRVVAPPVAAVLSLVFAGLLFWTAGVERENLAWMQAMAQEGEIQFYARQVGAEWPIVVQR